jgi:hypothetical protein
MPDAGRCGARSRPGHNFRRVAALVQQPREAAERAVARLERARSLRGVLGGLRKRAVGPRMPEAGNPSDTPIRQGPGKRFRRRASIVVGSLLVAVAGWFWWSHELSVGCAERTCPASATEPPIRLASGTSLPVIDFRRSADGRLIVEYLSTANP